MPKVLFLCTANRCRSPMAAAILRRILARDNCEGWAVESAGTDVVPGSGAPEEALTVAEQVGINLSAHRAKPLSEELALWADLILVMEPRHAEYVRERFPGHSSKVRLLASFRPGPEESDSILDPVGMSAYHYRLFFGELMQAVEGLYRSLRTV